MDERPKYKMRFVGYDANGELKPTAPAYKKGEIRMLPLEYAQDSWWELVDAIPDLVIPEALYEDSVFIEEVFAPSEIEETETTEASEVFTRHTGELGDALTVKVDFDEAAVDEVQHDEVGVILYDQMTVKSLKLFIEQRGGEVDASWRKADLIREAQRLEESLRTPSESS